LENASNALLMAAGTLIGVLILTLFAYLYSSFSTEAKRNYETITQSQITEYNAQYNVYEGRKDLSIYEVVSMISKAREHNEKYKDNSLYDSDYKVVVSVDGKDEANVKGNVNSLTKINTLLENASNNQFSQTYKCNSITYHDNSGMVYEVKIVKN